MALDVVRVTCEHGSDSGSVVVTLFRDPDDGQGWGTTLAHTSTVGADLHDDEWPSHPGRDWYGAQANSPGEKRIRVLLACEHCGMGRDTLVNLSTLTPVLNTLAEHHLGAITLTALLRRIGSDGVSSR